MATERDGGFFQAAQEVYRRAAPAWAAAYTGVPRPEDVPNSEADRIAASGLFGPVAPRRYRWAAEYDAAGYVGLLGAYADHLDLAPAPRARLFDGLAEMIDARFGGHIVKGYLTVLNVARRP